MRVIVAALVLVVGLGLLVAVSGDDVVFPRTLSVGQQPIAGPIEVKEVTVEWDNTQETTYPDKTKVTLYADWVQIEEGVRLRPDKNLLTFVPRSTVRRITMTR